jgi:hypothetical protein
LALNLETLETLETERSPKMTALVKTQETESARKAYRYARFVAYLRNRDSEIEKMAETMAVMGWNAGAVRYLVENRSRLVDGWLSVDVLLSVATSGGRDEVKAARAELAEGLRSGALEWRGRFGRSYYRAA